MAGETVTALREWVASCLSAPEPFALFEAGSREAVADVDTSAQPPKYAPDVAHAAPRALSLQATKPNLL